MQARLPPRNVILNAKDALLKWCYIATCNVDSQIVVNPREMRLEECFRKGRQLPFQLAFARIGTPQSRVLVASSDTNEDISTLEYEDLIQHWIHLLL